MLSAVAAEFVTARYLTDGSGLYWIVRVDEDRLTVLLEDCSCPAAGLTEHKVGALAADGYRVVTAATKSSEPFA